MKGMREVEIDAIPLDRLVSLLAPERAARLARYADRAREILAGRTIWNVNATAQGGGVAEMLQALLTYTKGAGVQTRWLVLRGDAEFFTITKRLHNVLHGMAGDGGPLGLAEQRHYHDVLAQNFEVLRPMVRPGGLACRSRSRSPASRAPVVGLTRSRSARSGPRQVSMARSRRAKWSSPALARRYACEARRQRCSWPGGA